MPIIRMLPLVSKRTSTPAWTAEQDEPRKEDDHEIEMAMSQLEQAIESAEKIVRKVKEQGHEELESWVQSKLTKSADYLQSVANYFDGHDGMDDKPNTPDDL